MFKILDADLAHLNTRLEVVVDDNLFPAYASAKARSKTHSFNETGDLMVRELDLSTLTLRLVEHEDKKGEGGDDHIKAKLQGSTLETLKRCLYTPTQLHLKSADGRDSKITISLRYIPVKMQLDPSESFNNSGSLRVDVLDAADLPAADRNGYSDPYCKFNLEGKEVYKTKIQKKTLHPAWNEFFEVPVRSRTHSKFEVTVFDWDFGDKADLLGNAVINLDIIEPFKSQEVTLGLDGKSGALRLKMLFKPGYVVRSRQGSSTFSGTFSTPGKVIGAPVKGVGKGAVLLGGGMSKGASFVGRGFGFRNRKSQGQNGDFDTDAEAAYTNGVSSIDEPRAPGSPNGVAAPAIGASALAGGAAVAGGAALNGNKELPITPHQRQRSFGAGSQSPGAAEAGTATVSVVSAKGFSAEHKLEVEILHDAPRGLSRVLKTKAVKAQGGEVTYGDETKKVPCSADATFRLHVRDHKTFGSDDLGEASFFIKDQGSGGQQEVRVGSGVVVISSSFQPSDTQSTIGSVMDSPSSKSKGGFGRNFLSKRERSVTPGA